MAFGASVKLEVVNLCYLGYECIFIEIDEDNAMVKLKLLSQDDVLELIFEFVRSGDNYQIINMKLKGASPLKLFILERRIKILFNNKSEAPLIERAEEILRVYEVLESKVISLRTIKNKLGKRKDPFEVIEELMAEEGGSEEKESLELILTGQLVEILEILEEIYDSCIVCQEKFEISLTRPSICSSEFCLSVYQDLHVGNLEAEIILDVDAVLLLAELTKVAAGTSRFLPSPVGTVYGIDSIEKVKELLDNLPGKEDLLVATEERGLMDLVGEVTYRLLLWIIMSNRMDLRSVGSEENPEIYKKTEAKQVFHIKTLSPEKEAEF